MFLPKMVGTPKVLAPLSWFKESYAVLCVFRVFGDLRAMLLKQVSRCGQMSCLSLCREPLL